MYLIIIFLSIGIDVYYIRLENPIVGISTGLKAWIVGCVVCLFVISFNLNSYLLVMVSRVNNFIVSSSSHC